MSNTIEIRIPNPCNESWDAMQPNGCGRFCNSCEKVVVDFTKLSDEEFVSYFQNNETIPCGRLTQRQLALSIPSKTQPFFRFGKMSKYIVASVLAAISMQENVWAQKTLTEQSVNSQAEQRSSPQVTDKEKIQIKGRVVDENDESLIGATVRFKDSEIGTATDVDGNFILETKEMKSTYLVEVLYIGIDTKIVEAFSGINLLVKLENLYTGYTGDIVIIQRPNFWQRITKPFRNK